MPKLLVKRKAYTRKAYTRKDGTRVSTSSVPLSIFKIKDVGAPGRTPKSEQWYAPKAHTGWSKDLAQKTRIAKVVSAHKGDLLSSARSMQALSNVSVDPTTKQKAKSDADILFKRYSKKRK